MITAIRLQIRNPKKGHHKRTYVSANSATRYKAGELGGLPSPWRIVDDPNELAELAEIPQFERRDFEDLTELQEFVQIEMEAGARLGQPPVRANIEIPPSKVRPATKRDLSPISIDDEEPEAEPEEAIDEPQAAPEPPEEDEPDPGPAPELEEDLEAPGEPDEDILDAAPELPKKKPEPKKAAPKKGGGKKGGSKKKKKGK